MNAIPLVRGLALFALIALLLLIPTWMLWLSPRADGAPDLVITAVLMLPLLLPLPGMLRGRPYAFAWSGFIALLYFIHGLTEAWAVADSRLPASIETALACLLFVSATLFARWRGREIKLARAAAAATDEHDDSARPR